MNKFVVRAANVIFIAILAIATGVVIYQMLFAKAEFRPNQKYKCDGVLERVEDGSFVCRRKQNEQNDGTEEGRSQS